ncbi:hypothetical protein [Lysinibacillus sp. UGB7]|uniref:hypothetical protein n=1 Tax=Lysinibacillus TaxID=400634 RepID=UPI003B7E9FD8
MSILIAEGAAVTTVAKIIGDTPEMVMKAYAHSLVDEELKATKILSSLLKFECFSNKKTGYKVYLHPTNPDI